MIHLSVPRRRTMSLLIAAPFIVVACSNAAADDPVDDADAGAPTAAPAPAAPEAPTDASAVSGDAAWLDLELTDAANGETFTLASLQGQVVALEPMAIWCTICKEQQDQVKTAYSDVQEAGVRYISLGIDPNEDPASLAKYAERNEYPWTFVQAPRQLSRALSDIFGPQVLSAPSTPLIVLDADGEVVVQTFGVHGPDKLLEILGQATA